jgi:hypothetical protein
MEMTTVVRAPQRVAAVEDWCDTHGLRTSRQEADPATMRASSVVVGYTPLGHSSSSSVP